MKPSHNPSPDGRSNVMLDGLPLTALPDPAPTGRSGPAHDSAPPRRGGQVSTLGLLDQAGALLAAADEQAWADAKTAGMPAAALFVSAAIASARDTLTALAPQVIGATGPVPSARGADTWALLVAAHAALALVPAGQKPHGFSLVLVRVAEAIREVEAAHHG